MTTVLKLDVDFNQGIINFMKKRLASFMQITGYKVLGIKAYKTKHGYHLYIKINRTLNSYNLVACQAALGSDFKRELFNITRLNRYQNYIAPKDWNVLFEKKYVNKKLVSQEIFSEFVTDSMGRFLERFDRGKF